MPPPPPTLAVAVASFPVTVLLRINSTGTMVVALLLKTPAARYAVLSLIKLPVAVSVPLTLDRPPPQLLA